MFDVAILVTFLVLGGVNVSWLSDYQKLNISASLLCFRIIHSFAWLAVTDCMTRGVSKAFTQMMGLFLLTLLGTVMLALIGNR